MANLELKRFQKKIGIFLAVIIPLFILFGAFVPVFSDGTTFLQALFGEGAPDIIIQPQPVTTIEPTIEPTERPATAFCKIYPNAESC